MSLDPWSQRRYRLPSDEHVHGVVYAGVQQVVGTDAVMCHAFSALVKIITETFCHCFTESAILRRVKYMVQR